jgi:hypothetical protein
MLWKPKCHDSAQNSRISSQINEIYSLLFQFPEVHFNIILSPIHTSSSVCLTNTPCAIIVHPNVPTFPVRLNLLHLISLVFCEKLPVT